MPNFGRSLDEVPVNGPNRRPDPNDVARFPRPAEPVRALAFGGFVLDPARGALLHDGTEVRLRAKSLDVLAYLVRHPGRLIAKQELMEAIWPDAAVTDDSLVQCLVEIRRALGDDQAWVHTSRGRGYRFDGVVRPVVDSGEPVAVASVANRAVGIPRARRSRLAIGGVVMVLVAAGGWTAWRWGTSPAPQTAEAVRAYEEGERSGERRNRESLKQAIAAYERAIALDPGFAPAHAGLANTLVVRGVFGGVRPEDTYPRAREAALRAVELDPLLAEGHVALGHVRVQWDRDWRGAEESYRRALALDPNAPRAHMLYALFLGAMKRVDESLRESATALALRPESPTAGAIRSVVLFGARRPEEAIEQGRRTIRLDPAFSLPRFWLALALADVGRFDEAMTEALASRTGVGNLPVPAVGYIHGRAGRRAEALEVLRALEAARARSIYVPATDVALVAAGMGDRDAALTWLERAYDEHAHWLCSLRVFPPFAVLQDEPRFKALVQKMQFPAP
jgi:DNA-binding winged helix-turn-helix (wHTH) protein/tetratricopeptide (TPR) repeat protein